MQKVILVTGASAGLGAAIATYLTTRGHNVYGASRSIQPGSQPFRPLQMDVSDMAQVTAGIRQIVEEAGRLDVLINNAGLGLAGPVEQLPITDLERLFNTNVLGIVRTTQAALPQMRAQQSGLIINISSIGSENGLPYRGGYSASKAAVDRLTEALRTEVASFGIQACYIQPGGIQTDINRNRMVAPLPPHSPYAESFDRCYEVINNSVGKGMTTDRFGPLIEQIMQTPKVKRCYRVGSFMEKLSVVLKRILPAHRLETMLRKHYNM